jgi:SAM-dependent methyltransferase
LSTTKYQHGSSVAQASELGVLVDAALAGKAVGAKDLDHLDGPAAAFNYIRVAEIVSSYHETGRVRPPVLDWGCGYGQVSWLLQRRGVQVTPFDVERRQARQVMPPLSLVNVEYGTDPVGLPYASAFFGAVLSVGVLEHVSDIQASLGEVNRVLRPGGLFFIFMFPNRYSWAEWLAEQRGISVHPDKFTFREAISLLSGKGFDVEEKRRRNFLPRNLTGCGPRIKTFYGRYYRQIESLDGVLASWPPTSIFSGVLELVARKR